MSQRRKLIIAIVLWVLIGILGFHMRSTCLFRGLEGGYVFHPDEPKQVQELSHYLNWRYLGYRGHWHYDGYPYGLNHVDEWIMRPVLALKRAVIGNANPQYDASFVGNRKDLFYWARSLRVLYGMLTLLLTVLVAAALGASGTQRIWIGALAAMAPLSAVVTHTATGDIGADMFIMFAVLFLCLHARTDSRILLALAGLYAGSGFACKYNAIIVGLPIALYVLIRAIHCRRWRIFFEGACLSGFGAGAGILLGTPALLINWDRSWRDIFRFMGNIGSDHAPPEWIEASAVERFRMSFTANLLPILEAVGWTIMALAVYGLILAIIELRRSRTKDADAKTASTSALRFSLFVFPFVALLISFAGKGNLQPFHVSYLVPLFILAAGHGVMRLAYGGQGMWSMAGKILLVLMLLECGIKAQREAFFWSRDDTALYGKFGSTVLRPDVRGKKGVIKTAELEGLNMTVFRNLRNETSVPGGRLWNRVGIAPVPAVPMPWQSDWIFMNGPAFPRNDRMFRVFAGRQRSKILVYDRKPESLKLGVRTGTWPASVTIAVPGQRYHRTLNPNRESILDVPPGAARARRLGSKGDSLYFLRLDVRTEVGDAWVTALDGEAHLEAYRSFGSGSMDSPPGVRGRREDLTPALEMTRYLENEEPLHETLEAENRRRRHAALSPDSIIFGRMLEDGRLRPILGYASYAPVLRYMTSGSVALPAGTYVLECDVVGLTEDAQVSLGLADAAGLGLSHSNKVFSLSGSTETLRFRFKKTFAPYECFLVLSAVTGNSRLDAWRLRPDMETLLRDFETWEGTGTAPAWAGRYDGSDGSIEGKPEDVTFGRIIRLRELGLPASVDASGNFRILWRSEVTRRAGRQFGHLDVYIHLKDSDKKQVAQAGFVLWEGLAMGDLGREIPCSFGDVPPGTYDVYVGIWNRTTRTVLDITDATAPDRVYKNDKLHAGKIQVLPLDMASPPGM